MKQNYKADVPLWKREVKPSIETGLLCSWFTFFKFGLVVTLHSAGTRFIFNNNSRVKPVEKTLSSEPEPAPELNVVPPVAFLRSITDQLNVSVNVMPF
jgi:hypothetical protein